MTIKWKPNPATKSNRKVLLGAGFGGPYGAGSVRTPGRGRIVESKKNIEAAAVKAGAI